MASRSILIVEDDVHFGKQILDLFSFLGYRAELAADGKSAVDRFLRGSFDLVLSDLMLPEMNGVDVIKAIRKMPHGVAVPVLMMSAVYRNPKLFQRELKELGIIEFLAKPLSIVDLGRKVDAVLEGVGDPIDDSAMTQSGSWSSLELRGALGDTEPDFDLEGNFTRLSLVQLFIEVFDCHHPGELVLEHGTSRRSVCFLNGYPVWGESNDPAESLAAVLEKHEELDASTVGALVNRAARQGRSLRELLLDEGALSERRLFLAERKRVREVVMGCFAMAQGTYRFQPGDAFVEKVGVFEVNPVRCLGDVFQRYVGANELAPEVSAVANRQLARGDRYRQLFPYLNLPVTLDGLASRLKRGTTADELFRAYPDASDDLLRFLWLMLRLGIAETRSISTPDRLGVPVDQMTEPRDPPPPTLPRTLSEPFAQAPGTDAASREVLADYLALMEADCFTLLDVSREATDAEIAAAYEARMRRYSLTRLPPTASTDVRAKAKELLVRMLDAYETLSDPASRAMYLLEIEVDG